MCPDIKNFYEKIENISELNRLALTKPSKKSTSSMPKA